MVCSSEIFCTNPSLKANAVWSYHFCRQDNIVLVHRLGWHTQELRSLLQHSELHCWAHSDTIHMERARNKSKISPFSPITYCLYIICCQKTKHQCLYWLYWITPFTKCLIILPQWKVIWTSKPRWAAMHSSDCHEQLEHPWIDFSYIFVPMFPEKCLDN